MNIFLAFLQSEKNYAIPSYSFWEYYIKHGIEEAGYQWSQCPAADWALGLVPQSETDFAHWKQDTWTQTVDWLKAHPSDLFLSYLYPHQVDMSAIREIQRLGIPCVNFFCDHIRDFKKLPAEFSVFDNNWVPEYKAKQLYADAGRPFLNLPMPMWVEPRYRTIKEENNPQITFIGSKDIQRILLLEELLQAEPELPLAVYGYGWSENNSPHVQPASYTLRDKLKFNLQYIREQGTGPFLRKIKHRKISYETSALLNAKSHGAPAFDVYNELIAGSRISLGINRYESHHFPLLKPNSYSRLRDIEAPMLGACYLTEYTAGLEELYDLEEDIWAYLDVSDLYLKIKALQADPKKRRQLKIKGQQRSLRDHNIPNSLHQIIQRIRH